MSLREKFDDAFWLEFWRFSCSKVFCVIGGFSVGWLLAEVLIQFLRKNT